MVGWWRAREKKLSLSRNKEQMLGLGGSSPTPLFQKQQKGRKKRGREEEKIKKIKDKAKEKASEKIQNNGISKENNIQRT